ncbi:MAG: hypothetical protein AB1607_14665 [Chloroflexota bacterium]|jgi:hypothetical protein
MKLLSLIRAKKYGSPKKVFLLALLKIALVGIFLHITWSYRSLETGLGAAVAQVAIMYHVVLLMILIAAGIGLGHWIDQLIRLKRSIFHHPQKGSWTEAFMNLWGYELKEKEAVQTPTIIPEPQMIEPFDLFNMPARRGRKPTFPLERWIPIAMKWENRDPIRDAFTLGELIAELLGTNSDGSPIVSEQTYYSVWRQRAMDEIRRRAKAKRSARVQEPEKEIA